MLLLLKLSKLVMERRWPGRRESIPEPEKLRILDVQVP
jgi:hypothetical protein